MATASGSGYDTVAGVRLNVFLWGAVAGMLVMLGIYQFVLVPRVESMTEKLEEMERGVQEVERTMAALKAECR